MFRPLLVLLAAATCATLATAQTRDTDLVSLDTRQATEGWEAVGRLDIDGRGFCTAALIRDRLLLTAAHCVYDVDNKPISPSGFTFQAGLRNGRADATRKVVRVMAHQDYKPDGPSAQVGAVAHDIALLELAQPIRHMGVHPFPIAPKPQRGDDVAIVSYGQNRSEAPSLQKSCAVLSHITGALVMDCEAEYGSSGSPVFQIINGRAQIVSVVSAIAQTGGFKVSLGASLDASLQDLLDQFATEPPVTQGFVRHGTRSNSGAKFIRPTGN